MKTKDKVISELLVKIYDYKEKTVLTKKERRSVEKYYKEHATEYDDYDAFLKSDKEIEGLIEKTDSAAAEIEKQFNKTNVAGTKAGLQPGILNECVLMQTLARALKLNDFFDAEKDPFTSMPIKFYRFFDKTKCDGTSAARYLYYNKRDDSIFMIQYGNPNAGDAVAFLYSNKVVIEIKDMPAKIEEKDLLYDEDGKLYPDSKSTDSFPEEYYPYIERFNNETSEFEHLGHNYQLFNDDKCAADRTAFLKDYFNSSDIDVLLTSTAKDELIALKSEDLGYVFPDGAPLLSLNGSEIRTSGKNHKAHPFTPENLKEVLRTKNARFEGDRCIVPKKKCPRRHKGKGTL